jgi:mannan endo-1,4-beta-mannosidase
MRKIASSGMRVVRLWGFSCEPPQSKAALDLSADGKLNPPILDRFGRYNESALAYLDRVVAEAGINGLKVILPLVNFEPAYCGMEWWTNVYGEPGESKQAFYCNPNIIAAYRAYVVTMLNRVNTVNGLEYRNDPAIMSIEVANEPHTVDNYEIAGTIDGACKNIADGKPGTIVHHWLGDTTTFVRSIDSNHLISTGEEGYRSDGDTSKGHGWVNDGSKGVDFTRDIQLPNVSFATVHLYPDNWDIPQQDFQSWFVPEVIEDRANIAHQAGKPIILEETGFSIYVETDKSDFMKKVKTNAYYQDRGKWLSAMFDAANKAGYAGTMVWQAVPSRADGTPYDADYFTFPFSDPAMSAITRQTNVLKGGGANAPSGS